MPMTSIKSPARGAAKADSRDADQTVSAAHAQNPVSPQPEVILSSGVAGNPVPEPVLVSDYQLATRHNFNFVTRKTKFGFKCISLPAPELAVEMARHDPRADRVKALRDELLPHAIEEFKRWEARYA